MLPRRLLLLPASRSAAAGSAAGGASGGAAAMAMGKAARAATLLLPTLAAAAAAAGASGGSSRGLVTLSHTSSSSSRSRRQQPPSPARPGGNGSNGGARRSVFTYPAPRKLSDIMKVPLVRKCDPLQIEVRRSVDWLGGVGGYCGVDGLWALGLDRAIPTWRMRSSQHQKPPPPLNVQTNKNTYNKQHGTTTQHHRRCGKSTTRSAGTRWPCPSRPHSSAFSRTAPAFRA